MEIRIANYLAATFLLEREPKQWHALVLLDSGKRATDFLDTHARSFCCLQFDDVEEVRASKQPPTKILIAEGLKFAHGKDQLLVTCRACQGRSAAMAFLIGCQQSSVAAAITLLNPTRHRPNRLVVSLGDVLLTAPDVLQRFDDWRRRNAHIQLADHFDDIEKEYVELEAQGARNKIST